MPPQTYTLVGKLAVPCLDFTEWAQWMATANRHVGATSVGCLYVSTVFLGIDHAWSGEEPHLFETMIFHDEEGAGDYQMRCATWDEAERQHAEAVAEAERLVAKAETDVAKALNLR